MTGLKLSESLRVGLAVQGGEEMVIRLNREAVLYLMRIIEREEKTVEAHDALARLRADLMVREDLMARGFDSALWACAFLAMAGVALSNGLRAVLGGG